MKIVYNLIIACLLISANALLSQTVSIFAGTGASGSLDGPAANATFYFPRGLCIDATGNVYVTQIGDNKIRKITSTGVVSTIAGTGLIGSTDGAAATATFHDPYGVCLDAVGNLYIADKNSRKIREITPAGIVSTVAGTEVSGSADGPGATAEFDQPWGICIDAAGNLYVADTYNKKIRKITPAAMVSTFAGTGAAGSTNGPAATATFIAPYAVCVDGIGNVYVADYCMIRKISTAGIVSTVAGTATPGYIDGPAATAAFIQINGICADAAGNLYVTDGNSRIRKISRGGMVSTVISNLNHPEGICMDASNSNLYFASGFTGNQIMKLTVPLATGLINDTDEEAISVFPNPTTSSLNIIFSNTTLQNVTLLVYDIFGKLVIMQSLDMQANTINTTQLQNGIYTYKLVDKSHTIKIGKLVKK